MPEEQRTFKLREKMSPRHIELALKDGNGRSVQLWDRANLPLIFCSPLRLLVRHVDIGYLNEFENTLHIRSSFFKYNDEFLNDLLTISQEVPNRATT